MLSERAPIGRRRAGTGSAHGPTRCATRIEAIQAELTAAHGGTEAEKEARRLAEEALQAAETHWEADETARRSLGLLVRLRAAWRGA